MEVKEAFEIGEWVLVRAIVIEGPSHPEDVLVRFESHNQHFAGAVRNDHVEHASPPEGWPRCSDLFEVALMDEEALVRCTLPSEHPGHHESGAFTWTDEKTVGHFEGT